MQTQAKPRVGLEVLVTVVPEGGRSHLGKTNNLSPSGMLVEVGEPLVVGERIEVKLFLPGTTKKLEFAGEVTREAARSPDRYSYGVHFVDLTPDIEEDLEKFLAGRLERRRV